MILDKIVAYKKRFLEESKCKVSLKDMITHAENADISRRSFKDGLKSHSDIAIIGEIKKASPSKGLIRPDFDPAILAKEYNRADIQALSVLTETDFFLGHPNFLKIAKQNSDLPVLRKDFIIDPYQVYEAYGLGADAVLLIVAILSDEELGELLSLARSLNMDALVEVHDEAELKRAINIGADIIGINNRNLNDFSVSLETSERLIPMIPKDTVIVSESGFKTSADVKRMKTAGADALLIGETFMREADIGAAVKQIRGKQ